MSTELMVREGIIDSHEDELDAMRVVIAELRSELAQAHRETQQAKREAAQALAALRKQLSPLYRALQAVFGELDRAGVGVDNEQSAVNPHVEKIWQDWKDRLRGQAAKIIDALLLHRDMTGQQIALAIGIHKKNLPPLIHKLKKHDLISKNGDRYSLKSL